MKKSILYISLVLIGTSQVLTGQKKEDDNIGTQVVNVVKPYEATISDAFKIKETPSLDDQDNAKKENIKYDINSFPVASTFVPNKGKVAELDKKEKEQLFANYVTLGGGNYLNLIGELYLNHRFDNNQDLGFMLRHHSTQGGIKEVKLDDKFYNTRANLIYSHNDIDKNWQINAGFQHVLSNWYGLPLSTFEYTDSFLNNIKSQQTFNNISLGGHLALNKSIFDKASMQVNLFSDAFNSKETQLVLKPKVNFDIQDWKINTTFTVDYLSSTFEETNRFNFPQPFETKSFIVGAHPSIDYKHEDWNFKLGAGIFYNSLNSTFNTIDETIQSGSASKIYFYPKAEANLNILDKLLVFNAFANGDLNQNSYRETALLNSFVSPNLLLTPTNNQLTVGAGLKGRFTQTITFNVGGRYSIENNKALFKSNDRYDMDYQTLIDAKPYEIANSFNLVYDDINTLEISGEIKGDITAKSTLGMKLSYFNYDSGLQAHAWNLPDFKAHAFADINIAYKWQAALNVFYVGERKDQVTTHLGPDIPALFITDYTLKGFFDANAQITYEHNNRLSGFVQLNNLFGQSFERWLSYPVQGFQVLIGANYKFDF